MFQLLVLVKNLYEEIQNKNDRIVKYLNESLRNLRNLRNSINSKEIIENENPKKLVNIVETVLDFIKKQKSKGIKISIPKHKLQRLQIALAQVKEGNTSENLLN